MKKIPFSPPDLRGRETELVEEVLRSGWITTGPMTALLEEKLANLCGTKRTICLSSATAALEMTLHLLEIGPGDEVITTAYTYSATAAVICHTGARPVLVDTPPGEYHLSADAVKNALTPLTKAVIAVDIGGDLCDYLAIRTACETANFKPRNKLQEAIGRPAVIADAAHSLGAYRNDKKSGQCADLSAFSFHAVKNLTTAEGGALTWHIPDVDDNDLYRSLSLLSLHGQTKTAREKEKGGWRYDILIPGYKCNMTDIAAAIGLGQLEHFPNMLVRRRQLDSLYGRLLDAAVTPYRHSIGSSRHLYMVRLPFDDEARRDKIMELMKEVGVSANVHYLPLPALTAYRNMGFDPSDFPNAMESYRREITLPMYTLMTDEEVHKVCVSLREALEASH